MSDPENRNGDARNGETLSSAFAVQGSGTGGATVRVDLDRYLPYLDDTDLTETQKREMIGALWRVMAAFVDLGFGVDPVQLACGKLSETHTQCAQAGKDQLKSKSLSPKAKFKRAARAKKRKAAERKSR